MNAITAIKAGELEDAVRFTGNWRDYAGIAFGNFALTLLTLGIFRI